MALVTLGYIIRDSVTLWTEGRGASATDNFLIHGSSVVATLGTPADVATVSAAIKGLPDDTVALANSLSASLKLATLAGDELGVVVAGVNNSRGVLIGVHSSRGFEVTEFSPAVVDGIDHVIFTYLHEQLRSVLLRRRDALDFLCLAGYVYALVFSGLPRVGSAVCIDGESDPQWIKPQKLDEALDRNIERLSSFRTRVLDILL